MKILLIHSNEYSASSYINFITGLKINDEIITTQQNDSFYINYTIEPNQWVKQLDSLKHEIQLSDYIINMLSDITCISKEITQIIHESHKPSAGLTYNFFLSQKNFNQIVQINNLKNNIVMAQHYKCTILPNCVLITNVPKHIKTFCEKIYNCLDTDCPLTLTVSSNGLHMNLDKIIPTLITSLSKEEMQLLIDNTLNKKILDHDNKYCVICDTEKDNNFLVAREDIPVNTTVIDLSTVPLVPVNNRYNLTYTETTFYNLDNHIGKYLNHSCDPNTALDKSTHKMNSLKEIKANEPITFDYNDTEYDMASPFYCNCESEKCKIYIIGKNSKRKNNLINNLTKMKVKLFSSEHGIGVKSLINIKEGDEFILEKYDNTEYVPVSCEDYLNMPKHIQELLFHYYQSEEVINKTDTLFVLPATFSDNMSYIYYMNHSDNPNIKLEIQNYNSTVTCLKSITVGDELCISYGNDVNFSFEKFMEELLSQIKPSYKTCLI